MADPAAPLPVLHVVASINRMTGGPAVSVPELCTALRPHGVAPSILTLDLPGQGPAANPPGIPIRLVRPGRGALRGFSAAFWRAAASVGPSEAAIVHNHGLWMGPNMAARRTARRLGVPLVVSPRGMAESWSMGHHAARKRLAWMLYERENLSQAAAFHATSEAEARSVRALGFRQPIALVPNGVRLPDLESVPARHLLEKLNPELRGARWLLFLSRLHAKKGIAELVGAWEELADRFPDWHLVIAGAGDLGTEQELRRLAQGLTSRGRVTFTGHLDGELRAAALHHSDLLVLPSHSENFGMVVAEALAHGTPCVTTSATPWAAMAACGAGWVIEPGARALADVLGTALAESPERLRERGAKGRILVAGQHSWTAAGERMAAFYHWLLGCPSVPDCLWQG